MILDERGMFWFTVDVSFSFCTVLPCLHPGSLLLNFSLVDPDGKAGLKKHELKFFLVYLGSRDQFYDYNHPRWYISCFYRTLYLLWCNNIVLLAKYHTHKCHLYKFHTLESPLWRLKMRLKDPLFKNICILIYCPGYYAVCMSMSIFTFCPLEI